MQDELGQVEHDVQELSQALAEEGLEAKVTSELYALTASAHGGALWGILVEVAKGASTQREFDRRGAGPVARDGGVLR